MQILIATGNKGKLKEFQLLLANAPVKLVLPTDIGLDAFDVEETGSTLGENAMLKARAYAEASGLYALSDDTGLYVDALDGRPGIYPARYGGPGLDAGGRRQKLLGELTDVPDEKRTARFECVIALANPKTLDSITVTGVCPGRIATEERGLHGFGYDPIFVPDGYTETLAELADKDEALKNEISHRGDAARKMIPMLIELVEQTASE